jgi:hypothetical protein
MVTGQPTSSTKLSEHHAHIEAGAPTAAASWAARWRGGAVTRHVALFSALRHTHMNAGSRGEAAYGEICCQTVPLKGFGVQKPGMHGWLAGWLQRTLKQGPAPRRSGAGIAHCSRSDSTGGRASRGSPGSGASHRGFRSPRGSRGGGGRISRLRPLLSLPPLSLPRASLLSRGAASRGRSSRGRRSRLRLRSRRRSLLRLRSLRRSRLLLRLLQGMQE